MYSKSQLVLMVFCLSFANLSFASVDSSDTIQANMNWACVNNASCIHTVSQEIMTRLSQKQAVDLGVIKIIPLPKQTDVSNGEQRSSFVMDFLNGNAVQIPVGPMIFSIQRSQEYEGYLDLSLLKKSAVEGRRRRHRVRPMQMFIPSFLAFNAVGWMLLAIFGVAVLTVKALLVSKLALIIAGVMTVKKLMESATEKMMANHYVDHPEPLMMPYSGIEIESPFSGASLGSDLFPYQLGHELPSFHGHLGAESNINAVIEASNATSFVPALAKVKRQDMQNAAVRRKPTYYNYVAQRSPTYAYKKN